MRMSWWVALVGGAAVYTLAQQKKAGSAAGSALANAASAPSNAGSLAGEVIAGWESLIDGVMGVVNSLGTADKMPISEVYQIAKQVVAENGFTSSPLFLTAIAYKESYHSPGFVYRTGRSRYESHINDTSYGIMQTLLRMNANFTYGVGYNKYGVPTAQSLADPKKSMYQGAAFWEWLRKAYPGKDEAWYLRYYNGGKASADAKTARTVAYAAAVQSKKTEIKAYI